VIVSPSGVDTDLSIRLEFACTNNQMVCANLLALIMSLCCMGLSI
jgi:hypothetical protein